MFHTLASQTCERNCGKTKMALHTFARTSCKGPRKNPDDFTCEGRIEARGVTRKGGTPDEGGGKMTSIHTSGSAITVPQLRSAAHIRVTSIKVTTQLVPT